MKENNYTVDILADGELHVVLFNARNKDNKQIPGFKERRMSFITTKSSDDPSLIKKFEHFVEDGLDGEFCRMYYSVNTRNKDKVYKTLLHFLIDNPDANLCSIGSKIAGIAATKECRLSKRWMFDFDLDDSYKVSEFCSDISAIDSSVITEVHKTPHGYAVIVNHGFDHRELFKKWSKTDVTLKEDDLLCAKWAHNIHK